VPFIKRVIGMPGDAISLENGRVFVQQPGGSPVRIEEPYLVHTVDGGIAPTLPKDSEGTTSWTVPDGAYFVMGDNRPDSQDSRFFGVVDRELIVGRAWLRYFPLDRMGLVDHPAYPGLSTAALSTAASGRAGSSATIQLSMARP
jgi:signal peptidase I